MLTKIFWGISEQAEREVLYQLKEVLTPEEYKDLIAKIEKSLEGEELAGFKALVKKLKLDELRMDPSGHYTNTKWPGSNEEEPADKKEKNDDVPPPPPLPTKEAKLREAIRKIIRNKLRK